jgi:hypothetical protein
MTDWNPFDSFEQSPQLSSVTIGGVEIKPGDDVVLRPLGRADIFDIALNGKTATIASIEQDFENRIHLAVTVHDDPGQDLGLTGKPGHRFFFSIDEVEPIQAVSDVYLP